jgi:hypothetical protein
MNQNQKNYERVEDPPKYVLDPCLVNKIREDESVHEAEIYDTFIE